MKFILLSDIHGTSQNPISRKDDILETFKNKLEYVLRYCLKINGVILQAGDFSNKARDWYVLSTTLDLLNTYAEVKMYCIMGQHDSYMRAAIEDSPTTMGILTKTNRLNFLSEKPTVIDGVHIYGASWKQKAPKPQGEKNILVIHAPISKKALFPGHKFIEVKDFTKKNKKYDLILCGDTHRYFTWSSGSTQLVNTGPMLRKEGDEYNFKHKPCFFVWDSDTLELERIIIPHEPAHKILSRAKGKTKLKQSEESTESLDDIIQKINETGTPNQKIKEIILSIIEKHRVSRKVKSIIRKAMENDKF
jgi:predicted phosphodiesterase